MSRKFAIDVISGEVVAEYDIDGAGFYDWEDIAVGIYQGFCAMNSWGYWRKSNDGDCNKSEL